jgi:hypothetical protein
MMTSTQLAAVEAAVAACLDDVSDVWVGWEHLPRDYEPGASCALAVIASRQISHERRQATADDGTISESVSSRHTVTVRATIDALEATIGSDAVELSHRLALRLCGTERQAELRSAGVALVGILSMADLTGLVEETDDHELSRAAVDVALSVTHEEAVGTIQPIESVTVTGTVGDVPVVAVAQHPDYEPPDPEE